MDLPEVPSSWKLLRKANFNTKYVLPGDQLRVTFYESNNLPEELIVFDFTKTHTFNTVSIWELPCGGIATLLTLQ